MIELGLQRISRLLAATALPWRAIHVAGTNGKGSICAYISRMLDAYNASPWRSAKAHPPLKHARFTSPHLLDRSDCITLGHDPVPRSLFHEVERTALARNEREAIHASEFELLTATALEIFTRDNVDIGVVEVGMGGRLDATNIIGQGGDLSLPDGIVGSTFRPPPLVTAISSIGLDHQAFLGDTVEDIAREKAGIIKPRVPAVFAPNPAAVMRVLSDVARDSGSPVYTAVADEGQTPPARSLLGLLDYLETSHSPSPLTEHMRCNARTAFMSTWIALQELGRVPIDMGEVLKPSVDMPIPPAIEMFQVPWHTVFPGRLQQISLEKLTGRKESVLLDGAHNAQSAEALRTEVERLRYREGGRSITWVLAASDSKDATEILAPLLVDGDTVCTVEFGPVDGMPWVKAQPSAPLGEAARAAVPANASLDIHGFGRDISGALRAAAGTSAGGPLIIAGSLYLVGDVLRLLRDKR